MSEPSIVLTKTQSLCPQCGSEVIAAVTRGESPAILRNHPGVVEAQVVESGGQVFIRKRCDRHGEFQDLLASDASFYKRMEHLAVSPEREYRPNEPSHDHGIMGVQYGTGAFIIFDLTNRCNMRCEPCFMDANAGQDVHELSLQEIESILDKAAAVQSRREVNFLFSGGEPTLSPHFLEALACARRIGFKRLHVATNGIRFGQEADFATKAKQAGLHGVFLQIDGVTEESNAHRGIQNFMDVKMVALENILAAGLQVTLQTAVINGINSDQVGPLVQFAVERGLFGVAVPAHHVRWSGSRGQGRSTSCTTIYPIPFGARPCSPGWVGLAPLTRLDPHERVCLIWIFGRSSAGEPFIIGLHGRAQPLDR